MSAIIPVAVKKTVWKKYFNNREIGKCCICGGKIVRSEFHAGHIVSNYNGGPAILENLIPMCSSCNQSINRHNLVDFMERWGYSIPSSLKEISRIIIGNLRLKFLPDNIKRIKIKILNNNNLSLKDKYSYLKEKFNSGYINKMKELGHISLKKYEEYWNTV